MTGSGSGRVDPRALLRSRNGGQSEGLSGRSRSIGRAGLVAIGAAVSLAAFGTIVVRASDDSGALAFIRAQSSPRPVAVAYAPRPAYPVSYFAPRGFFQPAPQRQPAARQAQRPAPIVASYAPFSGFFPSDINTRSGSAGKALPRIKASVSTKATAFPAATEGNGARGNRVAYCVRTCDGFFFPLSSSTGSDRSDEAACNQMCPTSETKLYVGQVGTQIDDARARQNGRRYAAMTNAFAYRTSMDKACSCSASGIGLTTQASVFRDRTLKVGDVVMTEKGMRVFKGGEFPYREASFTTIERSGEFVGKSRETLRSIERASMPGRASRAPREARRRTDELADLRRAARALETPSQIVRYVGPDRSALAR